MLKKFSKVLLSTILALTMLILPTTTVLANKNIESDFQNQNFLSNTLTAEEIVNQKADGYDIEKISINQLIKLYEGKYNVSEEFARIMVNNNYPTTVLRSVDTDYYVINKMKTLRYLDGSPTGCEVRHQVVVSIYVSGSFLEIRNASDVAVLINGSNEYTWSSGLNTSNYTYNSVSWFSTGNLILASSYNLGVNFSQFFSVSVGSTFYYRKYFQLNSSKQW